MKNLSRSGSIQVAVLEIDESRREAVRVLLSGSPGFECVGLFSAVRQAIKQAPVLRPDVFLLNLALPDTPGGECIARIRSASPETRILALVPASWVSENIFEALRTGANACLLADSAPVQLLAAIHELHSGGAPLSAPIARKIVDSFHQQQGPDTLAALSTRELEIANLLARGLLYKEIATQLTLSLGTVRTYIGRIYEKLRVRSRAEAMLKVLPIQSGRAASKA